VRFDLSSFLPVLTTVSESELRSLLVRLQVLPIISGRAQKGSMLLNTLAYYAKAVITR
jgi:hypothetical protein